VRAENAANAYATIAVVDEGILAIKQTKSPNPHDYFYQKRALQVNSYDIYPYIFPDLKPGRFAYGAGEMDWAKRLTPVIAKRVNLIAMWSGILKTNGSGEASFSVDIPQFSGSLRIMAVAYRGRSFGAAEKSVTVADPLVVSSGLPRFMSPNDSVLVPLTLTNTTSKVMNVKTTLSVSGVVRVAGSAQQTLNIAPNSEGRLNFVILGTPSIGVGHIEFKTIANGETFVEKTEIGVRPVTPLMTSDFSGSVEANQSKSVAINANYVPTSMSAKLVVSRSPVVEFAGRLSELIHYPYGCVEQTTSAAFPQLYIADLSSQLSRGEKAESREHVQAAISKLQSMQQYNGGLSYWPGGSEVSWFGSVYASHFLFEARRAGFDVRQRTLDKLLQYLSQQVNYPDKREYSYFTRDGKVLKRLIVPQEICYSLYVLALAGKQDVPRMNYFKSVKNILSDDSRYMLACTYLYLGDKQSFDQLSPSNFEQFSTAALGGCFSSWIRDEGMVLSVLCEVDYNNPQVAVMTRHLSSQLRNRHWFSTQENAWAMIALGKIARRTAGSQATAVVSINGKNYDMNGQDLVLRDGVAGQTVSIRAKGGTVYFFSVLSGISASGEYTQEDKMLKVRRTYLDRKGKEVTSSSFKQNDLIVVRITLESTTKANVENVVITDMLPAGFEIENPRISEVPGMNWVQKATTPSYADYRDDRINLFTDVSSPQIFYYVARAVSTGTFKLGPVSADAMYNGEYRSYNGGGVVRVTR
jgi:uncharacterized protein YfaS (alpha-2-macroglobulin family)